MNIDWNVLWTAVAAIVAALTMFGTIGVKLLGASRDKYTKEVQDLRDDNRRLRDDMQSRLQLPSFGLDAIKLTEIAAQRKLDEIQNEYKVAIEQKDEKLAAELSHRISEIEDLRRKVESSLLEREELQAKLRSSLTSRPPSFGQNAVGLPCGLILLVRSQAKYGALLAVEQSHANRGAHIRYVWWYQPDGSTNLLAPNVEVGFGEASEKFPGPSPMLRIGPIALEWSIGGEGQGWVYYGMSSASEVDVELAVTNAIDISTLDVQHQNFRRRER